MGSMLRCDPMSYCTIYLQPEAAFEIICQLGEMSCVQFTDMNPEVQAFQRNYISEVCRCTEMERKLRFMETEMEKDKIYMPDPVKEPRPVQPNEMLMYENLFEKWEADISEMAQYHTNLKKDYCEMREMHYVLTHIGPFFGDAEVRKESKMSWTGAGDIGPGGRLVILTGVVTRAKCFTFEMMLWRISRGNIYYRQASKDQILQDPHTGVEIRKVGFLAVCQGEQLSKRMEKVMSGFRANIYPCSQSLSERNETLLKMEDRIRDLQNVLEKTKYQRCRALRTVGRQWREWMIQVRKTKAIYHTMNLFNLDVTRNCLIGMCWVPTKDLRRVQGTLEYCSQMIETNVPSFVTKTGYPESSGPPTYYRTNKFTSAFQELINAYGMAKYGEINPGLYTIATFPFLFSLMFGDFGHALLLVIFASWMIAYEKKFLKETRPSEIWKILFSGRYVILLLGLFSMYTGILYNDIFSRSFLIQTPYWRSDLNETILGKSAYYVIDPSKLIIYRAYPYGVDPIWTLSYNKIVFENALKMKMSIIIGVVHMMFGITVGLFNYLHFKTYKYIYFQFVPEILFLSCIFLWLVIMIFYKWWTYSALNKDKQTGSACAPQLLILFIDMVLLSKSKHPDSSCKAYMFPAQETVQKTLMAVALMCIPVMLLGLPVVIELDKKKKRIIAIKKLGNFRRYQRADSNLQAEVMAELLMYKESWSETMIYHAIHTIEFVLSTVSHTASYLRLWALSLAHAQLSEMLWLMVLSNLGLSDFTVMGAFKLVFIFAIWAMFTVSILVVMEGLSAFLHTLRLHWVEFMSKFFEGGGFPFQPLCFKTLLAVDIKLEAACKPQKRGMMRTKEAMRLSK